MDYEQVNKASQALHIAREAYTKAANDLLAAVEPAPAEIDEAYKIIWDDIQHTGGDLPHDSLSYEENLAYTILEEVRG
jgi:hypothetical protein